MSLKSYRFFIAVLAGLFLGWLELPIINSAASTVSEIFLRLLKLVSLPIIFFSIVSTASGMENISEVKILGRKVLKYTLLTTVLAATTALILFWVLDPVRGMVTSEPAVTSHSKGYLDYLMQAIPSNIIKPFVDNNVIGVMLMAMLLSCASLSLDKEKRLAIHQLFSSLFAAILKVVTWIVAIMPIAITAFIILFLRDFREGLDAKNLAIYLFCIIAANLIQAFVVLPLLLKFKGLSPFQLAKAMMPALSVAFFTKSSNAALPLAMQCAEERANIPRSIAAFSFPLCTTINMNGCAAFILTTVLFVSISQGMIFSPVEMIAFIFIATIAAIGNAGVPMGCYFLSGAILATMNVPLNILGVILPFYAMIDMVETAINVWSDSCVTAVVNKEAVVPKIVTDTLLDKTSLETA